MFVKMAMEFSVSGWVRCLALNMKNHILPRACGSVNSTKNLNDVSGAKTRRVLELEMAVTEKPVVGSGTPAVAPAAAPAVALPAPVLGPDGNPIPPKRSPGHRGADVKDTVAEMAAKAHEISLEAGSKMAAAMKDVVNGAAGISGFVVESARDLVQFMVRRGQMTQEEADKLMRAAEEFQSTRKPRTSAPAKAAASKPASKASSHKPAKPKSAPKAKKSVKKPAAKAKPKAKSSGKAAKGKKR